MKARKAERILNPVYLRKYYYTPAVFDDAQPKENERKNEDTSSEQASKRLKI